MHNCYKVMSLCIVLWTLPWYLFVLARLLLEGYSLVRYLVVVLGMRGRYYPRNKTPKNRNAFDEEDEDDEDIVFPRSSSTRN